MPEVSFEIKGLKELAANRSKLSKSFEKSMLRTGLRNAAKPVVKRAKENVLKQDLYQTGDLYENIGSKAKVTRRGVGFVNIAPGADEFYGGFHEIGTSQHPAKPWLRPALDQAFESGEIDDAFIASLNKSIARALRKVSG